MAKMHIEGGIMVFEPTMEQFRDFPKFISMMEDQGAHHHGVAKVMWSSIACIWMDIRVCVDNTTQRMASS